jgi:organic radical activating enzyme
MTDKFDQYRIFKDELDNISPTFCVAKWKQATTHLESGLTHSCHHPKAHRINPDDLLENVSSLHNTPKKREMRKQMLSGEIVEECEYCNRVERSKTQASFSDRVYKSFEEWARPYIPEILENGYDYDVFPSYFEISFSSVCNCVCIYCSPTFSTGWVKEISKFGPYTVSISSRGFKDSPPPLFMGNKNNPYIKAFWKWWPELHKKLEVFRITGGEPLLSKNTFELMDYMIEHPREDLKFEINSNFCINNKLFERFIKKIKKISKNQIVRVYTSGEAHGAQCEYIRPGLNYKNWLENCRTYLSEVDGGLSFMSTYNILSIASFQKFLNDILELKRSAGNKVHIDIPFLMNPIYLQASIITKDFLKYIEESINFIFGHLQIKYWPPLAGRGFFEHEAFKLVRIYNMVHYRPENSTVTMARKDFASFVDQHDQRYGTNFAEVFPEYKDFYNYCKGIGKNE